MDPFKGATVPHSRPITLLATAAVIPLTALAVAGCGGGGNNNNATGASPPPKAASGQAATVGVQNSSLGKILDNSKGDTLYLFQKDTSTKSTCTGACASAWPPLRVSGKPVAGTGANASKLGTTPRSDGKAQVTYNGHPLYTFTSDQSPGDTSGQGVNAFGARWYVVSPAGSQVTAKSSSSGSGGGGGLGY
jgi:predicted lipoprotein with Yx(FWY)xxD motif